jgi:hypothetical protein
MAQKQASRNAGGSDGLLGAPRTADQSRPLLADRFAQIVYAAIDDVPIDHRAGIGTARECCVAQISGCNRDEDADDQSKRETHRHLLGVEVPAIVPPVDGVASQERAVAAAGSG